MSFIKKHIETVILYAVLVLLFAVGAFYDLDISSRFADVDNSFARFLEIWAEPPSLLFVSFAFCALGVCIYRQGGKYLSGVCTLAGAITAYITAYRTAEYYSEELVGKISVLILLGVIALVLGVLFVFVASRIKQDVLLKMKKALTTVVCAALATLVIISSIKSMWGRVRYRELLAHDNLDGFVPWYKISGKAASDGYKSFPSGHTSNASLLFMTYYMADAAEKKYARVLKYCTIVWIGIVMASRILCGAHFLTDVCAGAIITSAIILCCKYLIMREK